MLKSFTLSYFGLLLVTGLAASFPGRRGLWERDCRVAIIVTLGHKKISFLKFEFYSCEQMACWDIRDTTCPIWLSIVLWIHLAHWMALPRYIRLFPRNKHSNNFHLDASVDKNNLKRAFCMKTDKAKDASKV